MTSPRPRRQTDQDPTVHNRSDLMPLSRLKMNQPRSSKLPLLLTRTDQQATLQHDNQRMLMNLMVGKPLSLRQSQQDHPIRVLVRTKNPRRVNLNAFIV
jgi:hypothetical protein